jgi:hypothetical protein
MKKESGKRGGCGRKFKLRKDKSNMDGKRGI